MMHILKAGVIAAFFFTGLALGRDFGTVLLSKVAPAQMQSGGANPIPRS